jgi:hypothetical protein
VKKDAMTLYMELFSMGCDNVQRPRDSVMFCPSCSWLDDFGSYMRKIFKTYEKQKFDCDDYAIRAIDRATSALLENDDVQDCGHSFCYCEIDIKTELNGIKKDGDTHHGTNLVRCSDGFWYFFEPQNGQITKYENDSPDYHPPIWVWL